MKIKIIGIFLMLVLISATCSGITNTYNINNEKDNYIESNYITVQSHNIENIKTVSEYPFVYNYWTKIFNGGFFEDPDKWNYDELVSGIVTTEDGYLVWGNIVNNPNWYDFFMLKLNKQGEYEEYRCYDSGNSEWISDVIKVESWVIIVGTYERSGASSPYVIKINENLEIDWAKAYNVEENIRLNGGDIVSFRNGNNINYLFSAFDGENEFLIHIDADGNYINSRKFNTQDGLSFNDIEHISSPINNYFIIAGNIKKEVTTYFYYNHLFLMKIKEDLTPIWMKFYKLENSNEETHQDGISCVKETHDDGFIIIGDGDTISNGGGDGLIIIKTDKFGTLEWSKAFLRDEWDFQIHYIEEISIKQSYEYLVPGAITKKFGVDPNKQDFCFIRFGTNGNIIDAHILQLGKPLFDCNTEMHYHGFPILTGSTTNMLILSDGLIFAARADSFFNDEHDILISKISFDGYIRNGCCMGTLELEEFQGAFEVDDEISDYQVYNYFIEEITELIKNYEIADVRSVDYCRSFGISAEVTWPISGSISFLKRKIMVPIFSPIALVVGPVVVEAEADSEEVEIDKVEFYIGDKLMSVVTEEPYVWTWNKFEMGRNKLKIIAYNEVGDSTSDELDVWKFF